MDEAFWMTLAVLLVAGVLLAPIATFFLCLGLRRRQKEQAGELAELKRLLRPQAERPVALPSAAKVPVAEVPAPAAPARETTAVPVIPAAARRVEVRAPAAASVPVAKPSAPPSLPPQPAPSLPPPPARQPNAFETAARKILTGIWNWIIVGEEYRREGASVEYAVATNWLVRVGVLIVLAGIGFFLNYSSTRGWLGPLGKVSLSLLTGSGLIAWGIHLLGKRYHLIAQGLLGAGLATLYGAIFAAFNLFSLIGMGSAFALMGCVTVAAGFMSVRFNSMLVAILGILGGYGTPVMLSTGSANFIGLYSYMLLLGGGVLGIAYRRNWHLLNILAFAATYGLVAVSLDRYFQPDRFWEVMPFLAGFFVLFSTVIFLYQVVNGQKATVLELLMLLLNAGLFFGISYLLIEKRYATEWSAAVALGLAAFYTGHLYLFIARKRQDRGLALSFLALAAFFLIVTLPLLLSDQWLTLCWSVQALVLLWIAGKLDSQFLQQVAYGLYVVVFVRFLFIDLHGQFSSALPRDLAMVAYLRLLVERLISFGVPVASAACAMRLIRRPAVASTLSIEPVNDVKGLVREKWAVVVAAGFVFLMLFLYLHLELNRTLMYAWDPFRLPALSILWVLACMFLLAVFVKLESTALFILFMLFVSGTVVKLIGFDLESWNTSLHRFRYLAPDGYSFMGAGMRLLDYGVIIGFFVHAFLLLRCRAETWKVALFFGYGSLFLLFAYTTLELNSFLAHFVPGLRSGGISVYWGLYALGMITGGLMQRVRPLRLAGLALFTVVAVKVFMSDLQHLDPVYRIVAFILLGIVLLAGAFVYLRFQDRFGIRTRNAEFGMRR